MAVRLRLVLLLLLTSFSTIVLKAQQVGPPSCTLAVTPASGGTINSIFTANVNCTDAQAAIQSITVDWGDSSSKDTSNGPFSAAASYSPTHFYKAGTFTVSATATDSAEKTSTPAQQTVTVSNPAFVDKVVPSQGQQGQTLNVRIVGSNFDNSTGPTTFDFGQGISVTAVTFPSDDPTRRADATINVSSGATPGPRNVHAQNANSAPGNDCNACFTVTTTPPPSFAVGDVFVSVFDNSDTSTPINGVQWRRGATPQVIVETLPTENFSAPRGMAFDSSSNLYVAQISEGEAPTDKFDRFGSPQGTFGPALCGGANPLAFDRAGNLYAADSCRSESNIFKLNSQGATLQSFTVANLPRSIDLEPDQCTLLYTSQSTSISSFNVCTNTQNSDFATSLPGPVAYAFRILSNGSVLLADSDRILLLDSAGKITATYTIPGQSNLFALNLDPDAKSFWTADQITDTIFKLDIATGSVISSRFSSGSGFSINGLGIFGEPVAATTNRAPSCTLTVAPATGIAGVTQFTATANCTDPENDISKIVIDWGDKTTPVTVVPIEGPISQPVTAQHTYAAPGTYTVTVTATDVGGVTSSASQQVIVTTANQPPTCTLNVQPATGAAPLAVTANANCADPESDIAKIVINWGDNTTPSTTFFDGGTTFTATAQHTYASPGTYTVSATATDFGGATGSASQQVTVIAANAAPSCTVSAAPTSGAAFTTSFTATANCTDAEANINRITIDWGDGSAAASTNVAVPNTTSPSFSATHTYANSATATFAITATATDTGGLSGSAQTRVTVAANAPPSCTLSVNPQSGNAPLTVTATGNCTDPEQDISSTTLDFGDGTIQNGTSGTHTYNSAAGYTVKVTATDRAGLTGSATQSVSVGTPTNAPPICTLTVTPQSGTAPLAINVTGSCTDPENDIVTTMLDFGDSTTVNASSGHHTYSQPGVFTVKLIATDKGNLAGTASQTVTVAANTVPTGVFVGISDGTVKQFGVDGTVLKTVSTTLGGTIAGMAFDKAGALYATDFSANNVSKFDIGGNLIGAFGNGYNCKPESIVFDGAGNAYIGQQGCSKTILKFDASGRFLEQFVVNTENQGSDQIELSGDECTLLYTSEGKSVFRYDVCKHQQLPVFSTALTRGLSLRILGDGGVVVANEKNIVRLNSSGQQVATYTAPGEQCWDGITLDQDGTSFWAADFCTSNIYKFDTGSGNQLAKFNTGTPSGTIFGIAMAGTGLNVGGVGSAGSLTASPQSASLSTGQSATFSISFTANANAVGHTFQLSCANLPPGVTCSFSPQTMTPGAAGSAGTSSLTMSVGSTATASLSSSRQWMLAVSFGIFPAIVFTGLWAPRRRWRPLLLLMIVVSMALMWIGCGGTARSNGQSKLTPQGSFSVVVVGTSGAMQTSTPVNLTIH